MNNVYIFLLSAFLSYIATKPTIFFAKKFGLVTDKKTRFHPAHTHTGIIPRAGGIPIFFAFFITTMIFIPANKIIVGILLSSFLLLIVGLIDDYVDTSPYLRFIANLLISALVVSFGLGIPYVSNPFGGIIRLDYLKIGFDFFGKHSILIIADLVAIIWLAWTTNIINWSKGVDGQLPGFVAITAFFLGIISRRFASHDVSIQVVTSLCFIVSGSYLGFLPFNYFPQKIMPGYGGGALAGFLLGILSILSFGKFGTAFLILAVPIIDSVYTIIRRVRKGQSPFKADWGHLHHKLLEIGWSKKRIAIFYWTISLILGIASLILEGLEKLIAFVMIGIILLVFIFIIETIKRKEIV